MEYPNSKFIERDLIWSAKEDASLANWVNAGVISDIQMAKNLKRSLTSVRWRIKVLENEKDERSRKELSAEEIKGFRENCRAICEFYLFHKKNESLDGARKKFYIQKNFFTSFFENPTSEDLSYTAGFQKAYTNFLNLFHIKQRAVAAPAKKSVYIVQSKGDHKTIAKSVPVRQELVKAPVKPEGSRHIAQPQVVEEKKDVAAVKEVLQNAKPVSVEIPGALKHSDYMTVAKDLVDAYNDNIARFNNLEEEYQSLKDTLDRLHNAIKHLKKA